MTSEDSRGSQAQLDRHEGGWRGKQKGMKRTLSLSLPVMISLLFSAILCAEPSDKSIASRTAEADGVQLHYLSAGSGK